MRLKVSNVCQLIPIFTRTGTDRGVTFTYSGDGSCTINGTPTGEYYSLSTITLDTKSIKPNHKYLIYDINNEPIISELIIANYTGGYIFKGIGDIYTFPEHDYTRFVFEIRVNLNQTANNIVVKPQLFDLTEMYGAGNEPTTVEQFRQDFPNDMYEYSPVCWKKFRRLKYIANKEPVQLLDKSKYYGSSTREGVTFTNNGDGTWTVVGTAPDVPANKEYVSAAVIIWNLEFSKKHFIPGHKIIVAGGVSIDSAGKVADVQWVWGWTGGYDAANSWERTVHTIRQYPEDKLLEYSNYIELRVYAGATVNFTFKPQFFDLTEMYGAGNEPATVAQFRADFPNELYDYNLYNYLTLNRGKYIANKEPVQLLDKSKYPATQTMHGVTFTNNGDGTFTVNGTATKNTYFNIRNDQVVCTPNKKYLLCGCPAIGSWTTFVLYVTQTSDKWLADVPDFGNGKVFTGVADATRFDGVIIFIVKNQTVNNLVFKPQLYDLTEMYGAGNEPTTVEQFKADFPNELYDYNPYNAITFR